MGFGEKVILVFFLKKGDIEKSAKMEIVKMSKSDF